MQSSTKKGAGEGERREKEWERKRERGSPIRSTRTPSSLLALPPPRSSLRRHLLHSDEATPQRSQDCV
ncbi:hypothetical protein TIFTF001_037319 [Ficus carica]|uniref:Uncharacterized protein n=1 Tax=Ficus carica TaxID=3494 RepID=A0AA88E8J5_FICCA|nr:hypothetical protein TIFTF001_037319 [Ficus carica]